MAEHNDRAELLDELARRVAQKKAQGLYTIDALARGGMGGPEPLDADTLARLQVLADTTPDIGAARSTAPVIGPAVTKVKSGLVRGTQQPLLDLAGRTTAFNAMLLHYVTELSQEIVRLRTRIDGLEARLGNEGEIDRGT